jgi:hypothetical protein
VPQDKASWPGSGTSTVTELLKSLLPQTVSGLNDHLTQLTQSVGYLVPASQQQAEALLANTQALAQNTSSHGSGGIASTLGNIASTLTGGALSLSPILSGILSLFGGGSSAPPPLVPFYLPPSISFQAANTVAPAGSQMTGMDFNQAGAPRAMSAPAPAPQITVQVQAMDSRSFLDHSNDIAQAVRDAMLNMHSINDDISDI